MSKTTIPINGEECVILPAPKGAFVIQQKELFFVPFIAIDINRLKDQAGDIGYVFADAHPLYYSKGDGCVVYDRYVIMQTEVTGCILDNLLDTCYTNEYVHRDSIMSLYQEFAEKGTPMDYSAIRWFRGKFKEHNITKADFDVFA